MNCKTYWGGGIAKNIIDCLVAFYEMFQIRFALKFATFFF